MRLSFDLISERDIIRQQDREFKRKEKELLKKEIEIERKTLKDKKKKKIQDDKFKEQVKKYESFKSSYRTVKTSLKSVIKNKDDIAIINDAVLRTHRIIIHVFNFLKLYCLDTLERIDQLPTIDKKLLHCIKKAVSTRDKRGPKAEQTDIYLDTMKFYENHYKDIMHTSEDLQSDKLSSIFEYEFVNMITVIENHIMNNIDMFINRYINVVLDKKGNEDKIKLKNITSDEKKIRLNKYKAELRRVKYDILNNEDECDKKYNSCKKVIRKLFKGLDKSIQYTANTKPIKLMSGLIKISIAIEKKGMTTINCFPLRTNIVPKYIKIDAVSIVKLLCTEKINGMTNDALMHNGNILRHRDAIWCSAFKTDKKVFNTIRRFKNKEINKKNYVFCNQLCTDGIGCSILQIRHDLYDHFKKVKIYTVRKPKKYRPEPYVQYLSDKDKQICIDKEYNIVGIDPGKDDLIYATDGKVEIIKRKIKKKNSKIKIVNKHKPNVFRYSQNQRRKETCMKKYMKIRDNDTKTTKIDNKSVKEHEALLSKHNSKSCVYKNALAYIKNKNKVNESLLGYYEKDMYRRLKWYSYINIQKSEARMVNNFKDKFGSPKDTLICMGDFNQQKQMKYKEPTKGKGLRDIFKKRGYNVVLVNEDLTSKMNFLTGDKNEKFRKRRNPRPWMKDIKLWHGLLRTKCVIKNKSSKQPKHILVNRDYNGSMNIRKIAIQHLKNEDIPNYLQRKTNK